MEAARNRSVETETALLAANPDVDALDWEGYTVLMFAALSGQLDIVNALFAHGADVNVKNKVGSSALMTASGYPNVVQYSKKPGPGSSWSLEVVSRNRRLQIRFIIIGDHYHISPYSRSRNSTVSS